MPRHQGVWNTQSILPSLAAAGLASGAVRVPVLTFPPRCLQSEFLSRLDLMAARAFFVRGIAECGDMVLAMKGSCGEFEIVR